MHAQDTFRTILLLRDDVCPHVKQTVLVHVKSELLSGLQCGSGNASRLKEFLLRHYPAKEGACALLNRAVHRFRNVSDVYGVVQEVLVLVSSVTYGFWLIHRICHGRISVAWLESTMVRAFSPFPVSQRLNEGASNTVFDSKSPPPSRVAGTASIERSALTLRMPP